MSKKDAIIGSLILFTIVSLFGEGANEKSIWVNPINRSMMFCYEIDTKQFLQAGIQLGAEYSRISYHIPNSNEEIINMDSPIDLKLLGNYCLNIVQKQDYRFYIGFGIIGYFFKRYSKYTAEDSGSEISQEYLTIGPNAKCGIQYMITRNIGIYLEDKIQAKFIKISTKNDSERITYKLEKELLSYGFTIRL